MTKSQLRYPLAAYERKAKGECSSLHVNVDDLTNHPGRNAHHQRHHSEHDPAIPFSEHQAHPLRLLLIQHEADEDGQQSDDPPLCTAHRCQCVDLAFHMCLLLQCFRECL